MYRVQKGQGRLEGKESGGVAPWTCLLACPAVRRDLLIRGKGTWGHREMKELGWCLEHCDKCCTSLLGCEIGWESKRRSRLYSGPLVTFIVLQISGFWSLVCVPVLVYGGNWKWALAPLSNVLLWEIEWPVWVQPVWTLWTLPVLLIFGRQFHTPPDRQLDYTLSHPKLSL